MFLSAVSDTHGNFDFLPYFCEENHTTKEDILIIAGDSGILFYGALRAKERYLKQNIQKQPITLLCVRGNHDDRPQNRTALTGMTKMWDDRVNGEIFVDPDYPDCLFALDGGEYQINGKSILTIGGAYSVDKYYRLEMHWTWFADEQLSEQEQVDILNKIRGKSYDYIITHTCPYEWRPTWLFMDGLDQSKVDNTIEHYLSTVIKEINYKHYFFGHFHGYHEYQDERATMLYCEYKEL